MAMTYACIRVPMTFPVDNRRVWVTPVADMANKHKAESHPKMAVAVERLVNKHRDERILIHTVSYDLASVIVRHLLVTLGGDKNRVMTYKGAQERDRIIEKYRATPRAVLVAPSLDRGVDFKGDDCRVVIVAKVPFPNLGDAQVKARMYSRGGQLWYSVLTVRSLVQMTGRGVRSADDYCTTYILDSQFVSNVWRKSRALVPQWWADALDFTAEHVRELTRA